MTTREKVHLCRWALIGFFLRYHLTMCKRKAEGKGGRAQGIHSFIHGTNCWIIYHNNDDARGRAGNGMEKNTLAENLSPLNSHPETWGNWNGISSYPNELRRSLRLYFKQKPKCCLKSFQTGWVLWYVMFWFSSFCYPCIFLQFIYFFLHEMKF